MDERQELINKLRKKGIACIRSKGRGMHEMTLEELRAFDDWFEKRKEGNSNA